MNMNQEVLNNTIMQNVGDEDILFGIQDMLEAMKDYAEIITKQEILSTVKKYSMSKEDALAEVVRLDKLRTGTHNRLISGVKFMNLISKGEFFKGNINDRVLVGETALEFVQIAFKNRYKRGTR